MKYALKPAKKLRVGDRVLLKGKWSEPLTWVDYSPNEPVLAAWADAEAEPDTNGARERVVYFKPDAVLETQS